MNDQVVFRTVFKAAFAAGIGFTIGKTLGGFCEGVYAGVLKSLAEKGNKHAQNICANTKIKYVKPDETSDPSELGNKIGFRF